MATATGVAMEKATVTINDSVIARDGATENPAHWVRVWDPLVRIFHWGLVGAFATAWLTAEEIQPVHEFAGYAVAALIGFRIVWGFVGGRYARFAQFVRGPAATLSYVGDIAKGRERRFLGHNPAGAAMMVALLVTLSGTAFTRWLMEEPARAAAATHQLQLVAPALADDDDGEGQAGRGDAEGKAEGPLEEVHETLANAMLLLIALHLGGVALASFRHRENLARAMVIGRKRPAGPRDIV
jgi:cytochrome b